MESYFRALPRKRMEIAAAWQRWCAGPDDGLALKALRLPLHRLAGSALTHGFAEIGRLAARVDRALVDWEREPQDDREAAGSLAQRLASDVDALLAEMAQAREIAPSHERRGSTAHAALHGPDQPAVLLIEDDHEQALAWRERLAGAGFEVRAVESVEALEPELALDPPDLLLVDYWLGNGTAADLVRELEQKECFARIPRVCLTADGGDEPRQRGRIAGFAAVVHKAAAPDELAAILRHAISESRRR